MPTTLSYGTAEKCLLENIEAVTLRPRDSQPLSVQQISEQIKSQLESPLNYPPLSQAMIPGDEIVVAVEPEIPQLVHVLDGVLQSLAQAGANLQQVTVLLPSSASNLEKLKSKLGELGHQSIAFAIHDPEDEKSMAFLGVSEAGLAIRLNRRLCDADFVLPLGITRCHPNEPEAPGCPPQLYPSFSDREAIERLANEGATQFPATSSSVHQEIEACNRQLGTQFRLQVVPHARGAISEILAGESNSVHRAAEASYKDQWITDASEPSCLVVATLTGDDEQQTWRNLGRAIVAAESLRAPDGALVIYSELCAPPGQATGLLAGNEDPLVVEREIQRTQSADCGPAMVLSRALERGPVYLRSKLRPTVVESLGITPLESDSELERLAQTLGSCVVLEEAQHLLPLCVELGEATDE